MKYKINEIAKIAGISTRTLRYYDQIDLLKPVQIEENEYRLYDEKSIDQLQQILLYKHLGMDLKTIREFVHNPNFSSLEALYEHHTDLLKEKDRILEIIKTVETTIKNMEEGNKMKNDDKFKGLKERVIEQNEEQYGDEIREKYGDSVVNDSYQKMRKMSKWEFNEATRLGKEILEKLQSALSLPPDSNEAQHVCELHQKWIQMYWPTYNPITHLNLVKMYTEDERFRSYYEVAGKNAADFLYDAMKIYLQ